MAGRKRPARTKCFKYLLTENRIFRSSKKKGYFPPKSSKNKRYQHNTLAHINISLPNSTHIYTKIKIVAMKK